jgi:hypothetical protein
MVFFALAIGAFCFGMGFIQDSATDAFLAHLCGIGWYIIAMLDKIKIEAK